MMDCSFRIARVCCVVQDRCLGLFQKNLVMKGKPQSMVLSKEMEMRRLKLFFIKKISAIFRFYHGRSEQRALWELWDSEKKKVWEKFSIMKHVSKPRKTGKRTMHLQYIVVWNLGLDCSLSLLLFTFVIPNPPEVVPHNRVVYWWLREWGEQLVWVA